MIVRRFLDCNIITIRRSCRKRLTVSFLSRLPDRYTIETPTAGLIVTCADQLQWFSPTQGIYQKDTRSEADLGIGMITTKAYAHIVGFHGLVTRFCSAGEDAQSADRGA